MPLRLRSQKVLQSRHSNRVPRTNKHGKQAKRARTSLSRHDTDHTPVQCSPLSSISDPLHSVLAFQANEGPVFIADAADNPPEGILPIDPGLLSMEHSLDNGLPCHSNGLVVTGKPTTYDSECVNHRPNRHIHAVDEHADDPETFLPCMRPSLDVPPSASESLLGQPSDDLRSAHDKISGLQRDNERLCREVQALSTRTESLNREVQDLEDVIGELRSSYKILALAVKKQAEALKVINPDVALGPPQLPSILAGDTQGGGVKPYIGIQRPFTYMLRDMMGISQADPLPSFPIEGDTIPTLLGAPLLRLDWSENPRCLANRRLVKEVLARLKLDSGIRPILDVIEPEIAEEKCLESVTRMYRTYEEEQDTTKQEKKALARIIKRRKRRKLEKVKVRKSALDKCPDLKMAYGEMDFITADSVSEDETDYESAPVPSSNGRYQVTAPIRKGILRIPPWRSRELEAAFRKLDLAIKEDLQARSKAPNRRLEHPGVSYVPNDQSKAPKIPPSVYRWMVHEAYHRQYPHAATRVRMNSSLEAKATISLLPTQWGQAPPYPVVPQPLMSTALPEGQAQGFGSLSVPSLAGQLNYPFPVSLPTQSPLFRGLPHMQVAYSDDGNDDNPVDDNGNLVRTTPEDDSE